MDDGLDNQAREPAGEPVWWNLKNIVGIRSKARPHGRLGGTAETGSEQSKEQASIPPRLMLVLFTFIVYAGRTVRVAKNREN